MIAFIAGTCTPLRMTLIPASARIVSNSDGYVAVPVADQKAGAAAGVLQVDGEIAGGLGDPRGGRVRSGAEDAYPAGGVLDDGQDVDAGAGQCCRLEEVGGEDGLGLGA
jgi:hypothetical protein